MTEGMMTRRAALRGGAAFAGALVLGAGRDASWRSGPRRPSLVVFCSTEARRACSTAPASFLRERRVWSDDEQRARPRERAHRGRPIPGRSSRSGPRPHGLRELPARDPPAARAGPCGGAGVERPQSAPAPGLGHARGSGSLRGCERPGPASGSRFRSSGGGRIRLERILDLGRWRRGLARGSRTGYARPTAYGQKCPECATKARRLPRSSCSSAPEQASSSPSPRTRAGPTASSTRTRRQRRASAGDHGADHAGPVGVPEHAYALRDRNVVTLLVGRVQPHGSRVRPRAWWHGDA